MAGRRVIRTRPITRVQTPNVEDATTQRALDVLAGAVQTLQARRERDVITGQDLVVGTNKIRHGLGRPLVSYTLTPSLSNINFAHAIDKSNPRPDLEVWIDVVGSDSSDVVIEVY